jgi:hypothetical protein
MAVFTPKPGILFGLSNQNLPWWKCLAELIDNSFDHGADRVEIIEDTKRRAVTICDNGKGMESVVSAIVLGDSKPTGSSRVGRYGVGIKDAWLSTGKKIEIDTVRNGMRSTLALDTTSFDDNWSGPDPQIETTEDKSGTKITLYLRKERSMPSDNNVYEKLSWVFSPGLLDGKQIVRVRNGVRNPLRPIPLPELSESVQDSFVIDGKHVSIQIGIKKSGVKKFGNGFYFAHLHRIIDDSSLGSKGMSCQSMAGMITLGDGWKLSKNKDAITDNQDALEDAIFQRIKHLLEKAESESKDVESAMIKGELERALNDAFQEAKREARSSRKESIGTVEPKYTGRKRTSAQKIHEDKPGSVVVSGGRRVSGMRIDWYDNEDEEIGTYDQMANTVKLNKLNPFVKEAKATKNNSALLLIAIAIFTDWQCLHRDMQRVMFPVADFLPTFSTLLKSVRYPSND